MEPCPLENLYHYRFASEFLYEDPFQLSASAWPSTRGRILPEVSERTAASVPHGRTARTHIYKRDHRVDSTFSLRIYWSKYGTFRVGTWITRAIQKLSTCGPFGTAIASPAPISSKAISGQWSTDQHSCVGKRCATSRYAGSSNSALQPSERLMNKARIFPYPSQNAAVI
jgi:hypothetical protein